MLQGTLSISPCLVAAEGQWLAAPVASGCSAVVNLDKQSATTFCSPIKCRTVKSNSCSLSAQRSSLQLESSCVEPLQRSMVSRTVKCLPSK